MSKRKSTRDINTRTSKKEKKEKNDNTAPTSLDDDPVTNASSSSNKGTDEKRAFVSVNYYCKTGNCSRFKDNGTHDTVGLNVRTFVDPISGFNHHQITHMLEWDGGDRPRDPSNPSIYTKNLMKILKRIEEGTAAYQEAKIAALEDKIRILTEGDTRLECNCVCDCKKAVCVCPHVCGRHNTQSSGMTSL